MGKLFVNNVELELFENIDISLDSKLSDVNDLTAGFGTSTKTIKIALTKKNKSILKFPDNLNSFGRLNNNENFEAEYIEDGYDIKGLLRTTNIYYDYVEAVIVSNNLAWVYLLGNTFIEELDLSEWVHELSDANVTASFSNKDYVYPVIDYGGLNGLITLTQIFPSVNIHSIIVKAINALGYKIDSDFFDSDFFQKLYFPFTQKLFQNSPEFAENREFYNTKTSGNTYLFAQAIDTSDVNNVNRIFIDDTISGNINGNYTTATGAYNGDTLTKTDIRFVATIDLRGFIAADEYSKYRFYIEAGGFVLAEKIVDVDNTGEFTQLNYFEIITLDTEVVTILETQEVFIRCQLIETSMLPSVTGTAAVNSLAYRNGSTYYNKVSRKLFEGHTVDFKYNLPTELRVIDLIASIRDIFNLKFDTNTNTRTITIEPEDDFYNDTSAAINWTNKLDNAKVVKFSYPSPPFKQLFHYKPDSTDFFITEKEKLNNEPFSYNEFAFDNVFSRDVKTVGNTLFSPTLSQAQPKIGLSQTKIPRLWSTGISPTLQTQHNLRILHYKGNVALQTGESWQFYNNTALTSAPIMSFVDLTDGNNNSLAFEDYAGVNGLKEKYFRNKLKNINETTFVNCSIYFTPKDIANFSFRAPIYLDFGKRGNGFFYVDEIIGATPQGVNSINVLLRLVTNKLAVKMEPYSPIWIIADEISLPKEAFPKIIPADNGGIDFYVGTVAIGTMSVTGLFTPINGTLTDSGFNQLTDSLGNNITI